MNDWAPFEFLSDYLLFFHPLLRNLATLRDPFDLIAGQGALDELCLP